MANVDDTMWFNLVGIVKVKDQYDGVKYYIKEVSGLDEYQDAQNIANWGSSFPKDVGDLLFKQYGRATTIYMVVVDKMNPTLKTGCIVYNKKDNTKFNCDLKINENFELIADGIWGFTSVNTMPENCDLVIIDRNPDPIVKSNGYITVTDLVIGNHSKEFIEFMYEWNGEYMRYLIENDCLEKTFGVKL